MKYDDRKIKLNDDELSIVREHFLQGGIPFSEEKIEYTEGELKEHGIVREFYSIEEVQDLGFTASGVVTSFDDIADQAREELQVGAPFADGITKWQLPIDVPGFRILFTSFPPGTTVLPHSHKVLNEEVKSGGLRIVLKGSILFNGRKYEAGDWFYIENGTSYSFTTDPDSETREAYWYGHNIHRLLASRISCPIRG